MYIYIYICYIYVYTGSPTTTLTQTHGKFKGPQIRNEYLQKYTCHSATEKAAPHTIRLPRNLPEHFCLSHFSLSTLWSTRRCLSVLQLTTKRRFETQTFSILGQKSTILIPMANKRFCFRFLLKKTITHKISHKINIHRVHFERTKTQGCQRTRRQQKGPKNRK